MKGDFVAAVEDEREKGKGVLDFLALVEFERADDFVGNFAMQKLGFKTERLGVGAVEDGPVLPGDALLARVRDELGAKGGFVVLGAGKHEHRLPSGAPHGDEGLAETAFVFGDHLRRNVQDGFLGAVVLFEPDNRGTGEGVREGEDVPHFRTAETVDGLIIITHDAEIGLRAGYGAQQLELGDVGVLIFVDHDDGKAGPQAVAHFVVFVHDPHRKQDEIAEVHIAGFAKALFIEAVGVGKVGIRVYLRQKRVVRAVTVVLGAGYTVDNGRHLLAGERG